MRNVFGAAAALMLIGCQGASAAPSSQPSGAGPGAGSAAKPAAAPGAGSAANVAAPAGTGSAVGASSAAGAGSAKAAGSAAADPWAAVTAPTPPETPETRKARAEAAVARVLAIEPEVAKLRHLTFDHPVPAHYQTTADFQKFVHREIGKEMPPAKSRGLSAAYVHLGLFARPVDLAATVEQAMVTQAGAYYDPAAKQFFLVAVPGNDLMLDTISAHELTHALQDQHFDLQKYLPDAHSLDEDASIARRFVGEGDATFVMLLYELHSVLGDALSPAMLARLHTQIERFAHQDLGSLKEQAKAQSALLGGAGGDIQKAIAAMDDIPDVVLVPLLDSYMKGALVALTAYEHGGWPGVDDLYRHPPESTEQVLHPTTKLFPTREHPHHVTVARLGDPELSGGVIGELQWQVYFGLWKVTGGDDAAAGWGGDHYSVTRRKDGRLIGRIATVWDTEADARQFATAYLASLAARFPGADTAHPEAGIARSGGGKIFVRTAGPRVFIVDGADDASALDALIRTAKLD